MSCHKKYDPNRFGLLYSEDPKEWRRRYARWFRQEFPIKHMLQAAKGRCKTSGLEFNITEEDLTIPEYCPIFPDRKLVGPEGGRDENNYSLDRIDNSKGYIKGNVRVISYYANLRKANLSLETLERMVSYMKGEI